MGRDEKLIFVLTFYFNLVLTFYFNLTMEQVEVGDGTRSSYLLGSSSLSWPPILI